MYMNMCVFIYIYIYNIYIPSPFIDIKVAQRAPGVCQKSPLCVPKEPYVCAKRASCVCQQSPICVRKES